MMRANLTTLMRDLGPESSCFGRLALIFLKLKGKRPLMSASLSRYGTSLST